LSYSTWFITKKYLFASSGKKFLSLISWISIIGIFLGVFTLIVVTSVMNGYDQQLQQRILKIMPDILITPAPEEKLAYNSAPIIDSQAMILSDQQLYLASLKGVEPNNYENIMRSKDRKLQQKINKLLPGKFNIIIAQDLARKLNAKIGDKIAIIAPQLQYSIAGVIPRIKQFTISDIFSINYATYDDQLLFMNLQDAHKFLRSAPISLQLKTNNLLTAPKVAQQLRETLGDKYTIQDWTQLNNNFFQAVKLEKTMVTLILLLIIIVALFNVLSTLVMMMVQKKPQIAILRALGISKAQVMKIFMLQGFLISAIGTVAGVILGVITAYNLTSITIFIDNLFGTNIFSNPTAFISYLPSVVNLEDIIKIAIGALILSILITIYPARQAASILPSRVLRNE
jgi:lipoprotein-releasing system permease protein